jgi:hypothetical protein
VQEPPSESDNDTHDGWAGAKAGAERSYSRPARLSELRLLPYTQPPVLLPSKEYFVGGCRTTAPAESRASSGNQIARSCAAASAARGRAKIGFTTRRPRGPSQLQPRTNSSRKGSGGDEKLVPANRTRAADAVKNCGSRKRAALYGTLLSDTRVSNEFIFRFMRG